MDQTSDIHTSLKERYPTLSKDELRVAQENIDRYVGLVLRICKRIESDHLQGEAKLEEPRRF
jgi:hypothetical protein